MAGPSSACHGLEALAQERAGKWGQPGEGWAPGAAWDTCFLEEENGRAEQPGAAPRGRETESHIQQDGVPVCQSEFLKDKLCLPSFLHCRARGLLNERLRE